MPAIRHYEVEVTTLYTVDGAIPEGEVALLVTNPNYVPTQPHVRVSEGKIAHISIKAADLY